MSAEGFTVNVTLSVIDWHAVITALQMHTEKTHFSDSCCVVVGRQRLRHIRSVIEEAIAGTHGAGAFVMKGPDE